MEEKPADFPALRFSLWVYRALLVAYPDSFRQGYGLQMAQVFRDSCLRAVRQSGKSGMLKLWVLTLFDVVQSAVSEHAQKEVAIKKELKPEDIRLAGWALIGGAVAFVISLLALTAGEYIGYPEAFALFVLSGALMGLAATPLLVVGLLGLRNRYGDRVGGFGKSILLMGAILGPLTTLTSLIGSNTHLFFSDDFYWVLTYVGPAVSLACVALFGLVAAYKKPLARWNGLALIAGVWYPATTLSHTLVFLRTGGWVHAYPQFALVVILDIMQGIALAALGYVLKSDVPTETPLLAS